MIWQTIIKLNSVWYYVQDWSILNFDSLQRHPMLNDIISHWVTFGWVCLLVPPQCNHFYKKNWLGENHKRKWKAKISFRGQDLERTIRACSEGTVFGLPVLHSFNELNPVHTGWGCTHGTRKHSLMARTESWCFLFWDKELSFLIAQLFLLGKKPLS